MSPLVKLLPEREIYYLVFCCAMSSLQYVMQMATKYVDDVYIVVYSILLYWWHIAWQLVFMIPQQP